MARSLNEIASILITEKMSAEELGRINWIEHNNIQILVNQKRAGCSPRWVTYPSGRKHQELAEDINKITAEDYTSIPKDKCRVCKSENEPYPNKYYELAYGSGGFSFYVLYCHANGYCQKCAEAKSNKKNYQGKAPQIVRKASQSLAGDRTPTDIYYFDDGSIIQSNESYKRLHKH